MLVSAISRRNREVYALDQLFHGYDSGVVRFMTLLSGRPNGARELPRAHHDGNKTKIHLAG